MATDGSRSPLTIPHKAIKDIRYSGINSIGLCSEPFTITKPERIALCQTKIRPGEEAHRAYPPSYAMREPRRGLPVFKPPIVE